MIGSCLFYSIHNMTMFVTFANNNCSNIYSIDANLLALDMWICCFHSRYRSTDYFSIEWAWSRFDLFAWGFVALDCQWALWSQRRPLSDHLKCNCPYFCFCFVFKFEEITETKNTHTITTITTTITKNKPTRIINSK